MTIQTTANSFGNDVLHAENHTTLSPEEVAKAVARHQREHPNRKPVNTASKHQKTTPRG